MATMKRSFGRGVVPVAMMAAVVSFCAATRAVAQEAQAQQPAQQPAQQQAAGLTFGSDAGIVFNVIKADKTADFEMIVGKVKEALAKSDNPVRKQQAASWKVFKAIEPGPGGNVMYLFVMDPSVKDADYTVSKIIYEAFPAEAQDLYNKMRESYVPGGSKLTLQIIQDFGK